MDQLPGMRLEDALALLEREGIQPEVVFSVPPVKVREPDGRTARVVRLDGKKLLVSWFRDGKPKED